MGLMASKESLNLSPTSQSQLKLSDEFMNWLGETAKGRGVCMEEVLVQLLVIGRLVVEVTEERKGKLFLQEAGNSKKKTEIRLDKFQPKSS